MAKSFEASLKSHAHPWKTRRTADQARESTLQANRFGKVEIPALSFTLRGRFAASQTPFQSQLDRATCYSFAVRRSRSRVSS
jgi:hypothetical protein